MEQLDIFNTKPALPPFARNSKTSRSGALEAYKKAPSQCARILKHIKEAGERGMTSLELKSIKEIEITESSTMSARLNSLMNKRLIRESGMTRPGIGKATQTVWIAVL